MRYICRIAVLRVRKIFLNMRETLKKEFMMGFGFKQSCNILTYIDDLTRGDEMQTFVMEVVEKSEVDTIVEARRQTGLIEVKKSRSKDVLLKRGDQIWFQVNTNLSENLVSFSLFNVYIFIKKVSHSYL